MDIEPSGPLSNYFQYDEVDEATYLFFQGDDVYKEAFDQYLDMEFNIEESILKEVISQVIGSKLKDKTRFDHFEVTELTVRRKRTRIYDVVHLIWGQVNFTLSSEDKTDSVDHVYKFIVDDFLIDLREFEPESPANESNEGKPTNQRQELEVLA